MVWNWTAPSAARGTPAEAAQPGAWPAYEDEVLLAHLKEREKQVNEQHQGNKQLSEIVKGVYLDKTSRNLEEAADEALHGEFQDWLQGRHEVNVDNDLYNNHAPGAPVRRHIYGPDVGKPMEGWHHTPWRERQLTHLAGVREHLRAQAQAKNENELQMNFLAEHGPQNLQEAWMYFKHWVKGRPVKLGPLSGPYKAPRGDYGIRSRGFDLPPEEGGWQPPPPSGGFAPPPMPSAPPPARRASPAPSEATTMDADSDEEPPPWPQPPPPLPEDPLETLQDAMEIPENAAAAAVGLATGVAGAMADGVSQAASAVGAEEAASAARDLADDLQGAAEEIATRPQEEPGSWLDTWMGPTLDGDNFFNRNFSILQPDQEGPSNVANADDRNNFLDWFDLNVKGMFNKAKQEARDEELDLGYQREMEAALKSQGLKQLRTYLQYKAEQGAFGPSKEAQQQWIEALMKHAHSASDDTDTHGGEIKVTDAMKYADTSVVARAGRYAERPTAATGTAQRAEDRKAEQERARREELRRARSRLAKQGQKRDQPGQGRYQDAPSPSPFDTYDDNAFAGLNRDVTPKLGVLVGDVSESRPTPASRFTTPLSKNMTSAQKEAALRERMRKADLADAGAEAQILARQKAASAARGRMAAKALAREQARDERRFRGGGSWQ